MLPGCDVLSTNKYKHHIHLLLHSFFLSHKSWASSCLSQRMPYSNEETCLFSSSIPQESIYDEMVFKWISTDKRTTCIRVPDNFYISGQSHGSQQRTKWAPINGSSSLFQTLNYVSCQSLSAEDILTSASSFLNAFRIHYTVSCLIEFHRKEMDMTKWCANEFQQIRGRLPAYVFLPTFTSVVSRQCSQQKGQSELKYFQGFFFQGLWQVFSSFDGQSIRSQQRSMWGLA